MVNSFRPASQSSPTLPKRPSLLPGVESFDHLEPSTSHPSTQRSTIYALETTSREHGDRVTATGGAELGNPLSFLRQMLQPVWSPFKVPLEKPQAFESETVTDRVVIRSDLRSSFHHETNTPLTCLDISPDKARAVIAGRDIFKIIRVLEGHCTDELDLRAALGTTSAQRYVSSNQVPSGNQERLSIKDVKWPHGALENKLVTAATSGQIIIYDIEKGCSEWVRLHQHNRQVHRLSIDHGGALLLSGSQDQTIRLWDFRDSPKERAVIAMQDCVCFQGNCGAVLDVRWSHWKPNEFAVGTDTGHIQRWDIRKTNAPILRIYAHDGKPCYAVDWHPNGRQLLSAGGDKSVKVWNFSSSDRRMKPMQTLRAPQAVLNARWAPPLDNRSVSGSDHWRSSQVVTSFDQEDPRILLWDFRDPYVPARVFDDNETSPSSIVWRSNTFLWSASGDGRFTQTNIPSLPRRSYRAVPRGVATIASDGTVLQGCNLLKSESPNTFSHDRPLGDARKFYLDQESQQQQQHYYMKAVGAPEVKDTFPDQEPQEQITDMMKTFRITPTCCVQNIRVPGAVVDANLVDFLALNYTAVLELPGSAMSTELHLDFERLLLHNSEIAFRAGQDEQSKRWKILALIAQVDLESRAKCSRAQREESMTTQFEPGDFAPERANSYDSHLPSMASTCLEIFSHNDLSILNLQAIVWLFLNVLPWFPIVDHPYSDPNIRDHLVGIHHRHLERLGLHLAACRLRNCWARVSHRVNETLERGPTKITRLGCPRCRKPLQGTVRVSCQKCKAVFVCSVCLKARQRGLWTWCQQCGHGGHLTCIKACFFEYKLAESRCPVPGCECKCIPNSAARMSEGDTRESEVLL